MRTSTSLLLAAVACAALLAGCNSSGNGILGPITTGNQARVVFVNGSPDAGPVQVVIDNTQQFCASGNTGAACGIAYGQITGTGAVLLNAGSHTISLKDANNNPLTVSTTSFSVNGGSTYSVVLTGELHPSYTASSNLALTTFTAPPFSSSPAVDFFNASPYVASTNSGGVQFGYFNGASATANPLGSPAAFGSATTPQSIPSTAQNTQITFYAGSPTGGITAGPSIADSTNCAGNQLPCTNTTNHLAMYLIDGPAASTTPSTPPTGVSATAHAIFVGTFVP